MAEWEDTKSPYGAAYANGGRCGYNRRCYLGTKGHPDMFKLDKASRDMAVKLHPDLQKVISKAAEISRLKFRLTEGLRTKERQRQLVARGASQTMRSRHLDGHAFDAIPLEDLNSDGIITAAEIYDWPTIRILMKEFKQAAKLVGVPIECGGDWKRFPDGPHYQLPWKDYPSRTS